MLDGGHVIFSIWEWLTGRPVHEKVVGWLVNIFAGLLIAAMVWLTFRDVGRWHLIHREINRIEAAATNAPAATNGAPAEHP